VSVVDAEDLRPLRPRVVLSTLQRRLRKNLKGGDALGTLTQRGGNTIASGVSTADVKLIPMEIKLNVELSEWL